MEMNGTIAQVQIQLRQEDNWCTYTGWPGNLEEMCQTCHFLRFRAPGMPNLCV